MKSNMTIFISLITLSLIIVAAILVVGVTQTKVVQSSNLGLVVYESEQQIVESNAAILEGYSGEDRLSLKMKAQAPEFVFDKHNPEIKTLYIYENGMRKAVETC